MLMCADQLPLDTLVCTDRHPARWKSGKRPYRQMLLTTYARPCRLSSTVGFVVLHSCSIWGACTKRNGTWRKRWRFGLNYSVSHVCSQETRPNTKEPACWSQRKGHRCSSTPTWCVYRCHENARAQAHYRDTSFCRDGWRGSAGHAGRLCLVSTTAAGTRGADFCVIARVRESASSNAPFSRRIGLYFAALL